MNPHSNELKSLAERARNGNDWAAEQFGQHLQPSLVQMIRQVLRAGSPTSVLGRRVLTEVERISPEGLDIPPDERDQLIGQIARDLCEEILSNFRRGPSDTSGLLETVVG